MIERGALVVAVAAADRPYRGLQRTPLDALARGVRRAKDLARRYAEGIVSGDGVLEDLDDAESLARDACALGLGVEVIVAERLPEETAPRSLPVAPVPPAEGWVLAGHDVAECLEPWWSVVRNAPGDAQTNTHGLLADVATARAMAQAWNARPETEDEAAPMRVWIPAPHDPVAPSR